MEQRSASCALPAPPLSHTAGEEQQVWKHKQCLTTVKEASLGPRTDLSWRAGEAGRPPEAWWSGQFSIAGEAALAFGAWQAQSWGAPLPWKALRAGGSWLACIPWGAFDAIAL